MSKVLSIDVVFLLQHPNRLYHCLEVLESIVSEEKQ
jgi:hypothetical protein